MFRFVHAADLHLASPFIGFRKTHPELFKRLRQATFDAYDALIQLCLDQKVQALLIAGDIFDGETRSIPGQLKFIEGLKRLSHAKISVFICHGNHDPLDLWNEAIVADIPAGVHRFGGSPECVPVDADDSSSPLICGFSYPTGEVRESVLDKFPDGDADRLTIGLLHANVGGDLGHDPYAPCTVDELCEKKGYDYWALGHVHTRAIKHKQHPVIVYPGNTQGRHINEQGPRGVYVVEVDEQNQVDLLHFEALDVVRWGQVEVSIENLNTLTDLKGQFDVDVEALRSEAQGRPLVFQIHLTGRGQLHKEVSKREERDEWRDELNEEWGAQQPFAVCTDIKDHTKSEINREAIRKGDDFLADVMEVSDSYRDDDDLVGRLKKEFEKVVEHPRAVRGDHLSSLVTDVDEAQSLLNEAEEVALNLLHE